MDTRTGEILTFKNEQELQEAKAKNKHLVAISCKADCPFRNIRDRRLFCTATRSERRGRKCYWKFQGTNNSKRIK
ncbi:MAG: hypothetical protein KKH94_11515 [Candidatus Omnitrophica bacterium]|nr:hypothetical protein [Candidatus Omnitrophota bacterium]